MLLISSPASPYVRKVTALAAIKGLTDQIKAQKKDDYLASKGDAAFANPLNKIPVLLLDDGTAIYDSHVICEFLDAQSASHVLFPGEGPARWKTLTMGAMADGVLDAALLLVYEKRYRPEEKWHPEWMAMQQAKIDTALDELEAAPPAWGAHPDYGHLSVACALGYLDFRHEGKWRANRPNLVAWFERFHEAVPTFAQSAPHD